jgi:hypothetical protein
VASGRAVGLEWQGAKRLRLGTHRLTVVALDAHRNVSSRTVRIRRVSRLRATLRTRVQLGAVSLDPSRVASVTGRVVKAQAPGLSGAVRVEWQRRAGSRWRTVHKSLHRADRPFTARQGLAGGRWRVRVTYVAKAPYRRSSAIAAVAG